MFRHHGKTRTLSHNKKIASLLSFVAGMVNVAGFLSVQRLTTNVTGHFAFFIDDIFKMNFSESFIYFLYFLFFLLGSFVSNFLIEVIQRKDERYIYFIPTLIEIAILLSIALSSTFLLLHSPNFIAISLLFAMGLQNALVTRISGALVRTTHLTGLFTDLGIELSQLIFYKETEQQNRLRSTIKLRFRIILFFFLGGILAGILYPYLHLYVLIVPALLLSIGLFYDSAKFKILQWKRKKDTKRNDKHAKPKVDFMNKLKWLLLLVSLHFGCKKEVPKMPAVTIENTVKAKAVEALNYCKAKKMNEDFCILIDLGTHSGINRFFVYDFKKKKITHRFLVSHGCCNSIWGQDFTKNNAAFSNVDNSHCSSLGKFKIGERGYSNWGINVKYVMHGLDSTNNNALKRFIVFHSWEKVSDEEVYPDGTPEGWGCPAISNANFKIIDPILKKAQKPVLMWIYDSKN